MNGDFFNGAELQSQPKNTFTAVLPHTQVDVRDVVTAAVTVGKVGHPEDVLLDACNVVPVVAQHPSQGGLLQLGQLGRSEHTWVFVPESKEDRDSRKRFLSIIPKSNTLKSGG